MSALVRLPDLICDDYQRLLDSGADGLLVPRVRNPGEARLAVSRMMFPPLGERGLGITSRAGDWGLMPLADYVARGNSEVLRCMQLEDPTALQSIHALLDVPGVNAAFLGMGDLQLSSGLPATHPELQSLVDQMLEACRARDIPCGAAAQDPVAAQKAIARGFRFVMISNDAQMLGKAALGLVQQLRASKT
jgi:2-dehydro-3-deoxyglucarate aldolase/4-hydroxy-2-oxoheptanedioate aldolase